MSQELTKGRTSLNRVHTDLKKNLHISAATAVRDAARLFGRVPMIKSEREEMTELLRTACDALRYNPDIAKQFPLAIEYVPGQEGDLVSLMNQLMEALEETNLDEAKKKQRAFQEAQMEKALTELKRGDIDSGRRTLGQLELQYAEDADLMVNISDIFAQSGLFEDAAKYLGIAAKLRPDSPGIFNRLGIAFRKIKSFDESEAAFQNALVLDDGDATLYFNMGRLYIDQQNWEKAAECGKKAVELSPDFAEAAKMASYAEKQLAK